MEERGDEARVTTACIDTARLPLSLLDRWNTIQILFFGVQLFQLLISMHNEHLKLERTSLKYLSAKINWPKLIIKISLELIMHACIMVKHVDITYNLTIYDRQVRKVMLKNIVGLSTPQRAPQRAPQTLWPLAIGNSSKLLKKCYLRK